MLTAHSTRSTRGHLHPSTATRLRTARLARGLGLRQAAGILGLNGGYLSRLERGLRRPSVDVAMEIVRLYQLDHDLAVDLITQARPDR